MCCLRLGGRVGCCLGGAVLLVLLVLLLIPAVRERVDEEVERFEQLDTIAD